MRRLTVFLAVVSTFSSLALVGGAVPAGAAVNSWGCSAVNGFSTPSGDGYWVLHANGSVNVYGDAHWYGDASGMHLNGPIVGGAVTPTGKGYWLVAQDGGIFSYGDAKFYGSMGNKHLNQPIFSMAATKSGHGYWLVARDGGVFTFGDATFHGSTGSLVLREPITGITTTPTGNGYRLAARDGGVFTFGDATFHGSLPGRHVVVNDVAGTATTPSGGGYWMARDGGETYSFGDAYTYASSSLGSSRRPLPQQFVPVQEPVVAMFSNPKTEGYRVVTLSGATVPYFNAPNGTTPTGQHIQCAPPANPPTMSLAEFRSIANNMTYAQVANLVGGPGKLVSTSGMLGIYFQNYRWDGEGTPGAYGEIDFGNDFVIHKSQYGLR